MNGLAHYAQFCIDSHIVTIDVLFVTTPVGHDRSRNSIVALALSSRTLRSGVLADLEVGVGASHG